MPSEGLHQLMMVITTGEVRLEPPEFMPRVYLGNHQSNGCPMANTVEGDPGTHKDILEVVLQQVTPGVLSPSGIVCCQLEGLQFLR